MRYFSHYYRFGKRKMTKYSLIISINHTLNGELCLKPFILYLIKKAWLNNNYSNDIKTTQQKMFIMTPSPTLSVPTLSGDTPMTASWTDGC